MNIPWNKDKMGDSEYKKAFDDVVLPIIEQFKPDLVLVSSGFDAAAADPLGEYVLTSSIYGYMTSKLKDYANGRVILIIEGGYNANAIAEALSVCTEVLLGKREIKEDSLNLEDPCKRALQTVGLVKKTQSKYWKFGEL